MYPEHFQTPNQQAAGILFEAGFAPVFSDTDNSMSVADTSVVNALERLLANASEYGTDNEILCVEFMTTVFQHPRMQPMDAADILGELLEPIQKYNPQATDFIASAIELPMAGDFKETAAEVLTAIFTNYDPANTYDLETRTRKLANTGFEADDLVSKAAKVLERAHLPSSLSNQLLETLGNFAVELHDFTGDIRITVQVLEDFQRLVFRYQKPMQSEEPELVSEVEKPILGEDPKSDIARLRADSERRALTITSMDTNHCLELDYAEGRKIDRNLQNLYESNESPFGGLSLSASAIRAIAAQIRLYHAILSSNKGTKLQTVKDPIKGIADDYLLGDFVLADYLTKHVGQLIETNAE